MAGWTGLEPVAGLFSKLVMARDFWFKRLSHRRLRRFVSFTAVHPNPRVSPRVMETFWRRRLLKNLKSEGERSVTAVWCCLAAMTRIDRRRQSVVRKLQSLAVYL